MTKMTASNSQMVSAKLPGDLYDFLDSKRWDLRKSKTAIIVHALTEWAKSEGFVPSSENSPAEDDETGEPT